MISLLRWKRNSKHPFIMYMYKTTAVEIFLQIFEKVA